MPDIVRPSRSRRPGVIHVSTNLFEDACLYKRHSARFIQRILAYPPPQHDRTGHTWHHPDSLILEITANGGDPTQNSKMPAFKDRLAEDEMESILEFIKRKWGREEREYQWWLTATGKEQ